MTQFTLRNPDFDRRLRAAFGRSAFLGTMGMEIRRIEPGLFEIWQPRRPEVLQQHGFIHGGAVATIIDICGGHAAQSLMGAEDTVMTVEFKTNFLAPAKGEGLRGVGRVIRAGRSLSFCAMEVFAQDEGREKLIATGQGTYMRLEHVKETGA